MSFGRILLLVIGVIIIFPALALIVGGAGVLWVNSAYKDSEGFITTKTIELDKNSHAIVTQPVDIDVRAARMWEWHDFVTFKVEGSNNNPSKQTFIGIASKSDLDNYLSGVKYDEITEFHIHPLDIVSERHDGNSVPAAPTTQTFWIDSVHGPGTQVLEWELKTGTYSLVLMNADGSADVDLSVIVGAKIPALFWIGLGLVLGGIVILGLAGLFIYLAVRRA